MLRRIFADNFRALGTFEFRPGKLCLLLGENGSGKTSVFLVLHKIRDLVALGYPAADLFGGSRTRWDKRTTQYFELDVEHEEGAYRYRLEIEHPQAEAPFIRSEVVTLDGVVLYRFANGEVQLADDDDGPSPTFPYRPSHSFLQNIDFQGARRMRRLGAFRTYLAHLWVLQPNPFAFQVFSRVEQAYLVPDGSNFPSFFEYLSLERPAVRNQLEEHLRQAIPGFKSFALHRTGDQKQLVALFLGDTAESLPFGPFELSEGQRVLAVLYSAVLGLPVGGAPLCFDEPDNFVSLAEIQPWLQVLSDTVDERGGQALVISHHPEVIDYLGVGDVWWFERPGGGPVVSRRAQEGAKPGEEGLKLSELVARGL
jgi:predicted ATPase